MIKKNLFLVSFTVFITKKLCIIYEAYLASNKTPNVV